MKLSEFDERFHTKLENQSFHCIEYANSSGYKVSYYFTKQFYDEPFVGIQITDFSNGFDIIDYYTMDSDYELTETFKGVEIPIKISIENQPVKVKSMFEYKDVFFGVFIEFENTQSDDAEIKKAVDLLFQAIDEYIEI